MELSDTEAADQKQLAERTSEIRKSCETVAGWCLANIVAASIRQEKPASSIALTFGVAGFLLGCLGSTPPAQPKAVDPAQLTAHLQTTYSRRHTGRVLAVVFLVLGLLTMLVDAWRK